MTHVNDPACPKCGGEMDEGRFTEGPQDWVGYRSDRQGLLSFALDFRRARACLECGYVEIYIDPEKLRRKVE